MKLIALLTFLLGLNTCGNFIPNPNPNAGASPAATSWTPSASNWQCPSPPAATFVGSDNPLTGWAGICTLASGEVCSGSAGPSGFAGTCTGGTGASPNAGSSNAPAVGASSSPAVKCIGQCKVVVPVCSFERRGAQDNGCSNGLTPPPSGSSPTPAAPQASSPAGQNPAPCPPASILPAHAVGDTQGNGKITVENISYRYGALIQAAVTKYNAQYGANLTVPFVESIIYQESKGDPNAQSIDGQDSEGLMQVSTAPNYDVGDLLSPGADQYDPAVSIDTGVHLLALMDQCGTVKDPQVGAFYGSFPGACNNLLILASKFQNGPYTTAVNVYGNEISTWMADFTNNTEPTTDGPVPSGC